MRITILTMFPEIFAGFLQGPVLKRAQERGTARTELVDIKEFADGSYRHIDDSPYGGGAGMIMKCGPVISALKSVKTADSRCILFSPRGRKYTQEDAHRFSREKHLIMLCGHYEGMDERISRYFDEEICMGDYILTGGEVCAMAVADSVVRLLPGVLRQESTEDESFESGLLEYPQYTRPKVFEGLEVPDVLLNGNHSEIRRWRLKESLRATMERRPDLLDGKALSEEEIKILEEIRKEIQ